MRKLRFSLLDQFADRFVYELDAIGFGNELAPVRQVFVFEPRLPRRCDDLDRWPTVSDRMASLNPFIEPFGISMSVNKLP